MKRYTLIFAMLIGLLLLSACGTSVNPPQGATADVSASLSQTATPRPTSTQRPTSTPRPATPTTAGTPVPSVDFTFEVGTQVPAATQVVIQPTAVPQNTTNDPKDPHYAAFHITGAPNHAESVEVATGIFVNTIGLGSEMLIAEPGKLLVGPQVSDTEIERAGGAIERINPVNQQVFEGNGPSYFNLNEGGMNVYSLGHGTFTMKGITDSQLVTITVDGGQAHDWIIIVRSLYGDNKQDTDRNVTVEFSGYSPGHVIAMRYPGQPNGGFISEGQFNQIVLDAHTGETNCGDAGCSGVSVLMFDSNTGGWVVLHQPQKNAAWQFVASNWR